MMKKWEKDLMLVLSNSDVDNKEVVIKKFINNLINEIVDFTENELPPSLGSQKHFLIEKIKEEYIRD
jgi:hypothetical protein